jgi:amino acid transporter
MAESAPSILPRRLGVWTATAIVLGITIGSGIFRVPGSVAQHVDTFGATALLWMLGGIITLCLALSLAELATMFPRPGGIIVFVREAYGPLIAFLFGWTFLWINPASWAAIALIFAEYLGHFVPLDEPGRRLVAAALIALITLANYYSVPIAAALQNVATSAKALALVALSAGLVLLGPGTDGALAAPLSFEIRDPGGFGVALILVLFAYSGAAAFCALSGEIRDPARALPQSLIVGMLAVILLYLVTNAAYLYALPMDALSASGLVAADAMVRTAGSSAASLIAALVMLSTFGALAATALADPRVFFAMAQEELFFHNLGRVRPKSDTPHVAILVAGAIAILYVVVRGFEQLAAGFILGLWPFYALAVVGVIVLRIRRPDWPRPYRVLGYPWVPLTFFAASLLILGNALIEQPGITLLNVGLTLSGIPVYFIWRASTRRAD